MSEAAGDLHSDAVLAETGRRKARSTLLEPLELPRKPPVESDLPTDRFMNREKSWLDFNARVLALAEDPATPLLERAKYLAIFATNLDEFFMVRVAGLKRRLATGLAVRTADGLSMTEQLDLISAETARLVARHSRAFLHHIRPALTKTGITIHRWRQLNTDERAWLHDYFREKVFPILTPLAVDQAHPFPYISGLSLNLAVTVRDPDTKQERFSRVKVPQNVPRFVRLDEARFVPLEEIIGAHLPQLFPGLEVVEWNVFRLTRNADLEVEDDEAESLLAALERELARRRFGPPVRLEVQDDVDDAMLDFLVRELEISDTDVHRIPGLLDLSSLWSLYELDRPDLKDPAWVPVTRRPLAGDEGERVDIFAAMRERDILVHHPYDSFSSSVTRFIEQAAADPHVLAIKQTLYRTSGDSPIVEALIDAAQAGKQVVVLVELKARFDETANIRWARVLERAGCHVVYGLVGLKTHCKTALVVRQERGGLRRYCHIGTGNYNNKTARLYEDFGLLTCDPDIGADLTDLFNVLTGYSRQTYYRSLLVAPYALRRGVIERIEAEAERTASGEPSGVFIKVNSLVDEEIIDALYRASRRGTPVRCLVRGICALRPGVPGLSETIEVRSILGRFLEHSRVFHFAGADEWLLGSADMMHRNLDRRVEVLVQVREPQARAELASMADRAFAGDVQAWQMSPAGEWTSHADAGIEYQQDMMKIAKKRAESA